MKISTRFFNERGQALAEYMPLLPPLLMLSVSLLLPLGQAAADALCQVTTPFAAQVCSLGADEDLESELEGKPDPEEKACITLQEELGAAQCDQHDQCSVLPGLNEAVFYGTKPVKSLVIKAGKDYHIFDSGLTDDGCYQVTLGPDERVEWVKTGSGKNCKDVSHVQAWKELVCR